MNTEKSDALDFTIRLLKEGEKIDAFDCGDDDLNDFILNSSVLYKEEMLAITYLVQTRTSGEVLAYFSLANDRISITDFENKTEFNRFRKRRFVNEKRLKSYPAVKIGRLAIASRYKGKGIGRNLIKIIKMTLSETQTISAFRFLTVDAYLSATAFYEKNGFRMMVADDDDRHTRLMFFDMMEL